MKKKKILIISIITIILLLLITGAVLAVAYLTTDIFKTDEELFLKYFSQFTETVEEFKELDLAKYFDKQKNMPYENAGKLSVQVNIPNYEEKIKTINQLSINFNGKIDNSNSKKEQHFQINYAPTVKFPFDYKHTGDLYALASNIVANKYVAVRNDNLQDVLNKMGFEPIVTSQVPNKIEFKNDTEISMESINNSFNKYYDILKTNLKESNFSKIDNDKFVLTLTQDEVKTILLQILVQLKEEYGTINQEVEKQIEDLITKIQEVATTNEEGIKIVLHQKQGVLSKIEINMNNIDISIDINGTSFIIHLYAKEENKIPVITIEKTKNENEVSYLLSYRVEENTNSSEVYFKAKYVDITKESVQENYVFGMSGIQADEETQELTETKYEYTLDTKKTFSNEIIIEDLTDKTALILNDYDVTYVRSVMGMLGTKISQLNKEQMSKLGLSETENPLFMATPIGVMYNEVLKKALEAQERLEQEKKQEQEQLNNMQNMMVQIANKEFQQYEGNEVKGNEVKSLLQLVSNTVAEKEGQIVRITYNDQNLTPNADIIKNVRNVINTVATYYVSFGYNSNTGLVDTVVIKMNSNTNIIGNTTESNNIIENEATNGL